MRFGVIHEAATATSPRLRVRYGLQQWGHGSTVGNIPAQGFRFDTPLETKQYTAKKVKSYLLLYPSKWHLQQVSYVLNGKQLFHVMTLSTEWASCRDGFPEIKGLDMSPMAAIPPAE